MAQEVNNLFWDIGMTSGIKHKIKDSEVILTQKESKCWADFQDQNANADHHYGDVPQQVPESLETFLVSITYFPSDSMW